MYHIRQGQLFSLQELLDCEQEVAYQEIFGGINISPILKIVNKKSPYGAPVSRNYPAMIYSLFARIVEGIPNTKLLIRRLKNDCQFRLNCGFTFSDSIPSEASFSRLVGKIRNTDVLQTVNHDILRQAFTEGFIHDEHVAIDATHVEARDRAKVKNEEVHTKENTTPKKRGRKKKEAHEAWKKEQEEIQKQLPLFERKIEEQLPYPFEELVKQMPCAPEWGIKKNSEHRNVFWYGFKAHLAVGTQSQYILMNLLSSGSLNDGKAAIPLLKGVQERFPSLAITKVMADAGYDYKPIYQQINNMDADALISYNRRNEPDIDGFTKHFAPTCVREHAYRYDSYDRKYRTLRYVRPKECKECPLAQDSLCQKVFKIKRDTDIRKYQAPARGTKVWRALYKERSSVERVIAYLKEYFQLNNIRYRSGELAKVHFDLTCLLFNASKLAVDRINRKYQTKVA